MLEGLTLISAHLVADFALQTEHMAQNKMDDLWVRAKHCFVHFATFSLVSVMMWGLVVGFAYGFVIAVVHFGVDSRRWDRDEGVLFNSDWEPFPIILDQTIHVVTMAGVYWSFVFVGVMP